jgi:hypothetical protein
MRCVMLWAVSRQFWFWYGYRSEARTVARQTLR